MNSTDYRLQMQTPYILMLQVIFQVVILMSHHGNTVEPVLSGHPLSSGHLAKSRKFRN